MRMRDGIFASIATRALFFLSTVACAAEPLPNSIFIMADDMGWGR